MRKKLFAIIVLTMTLVMMATIGAAKEQFPNKPITVIVPWKPGGGTDILARAVCPIWEKELGVQTVILNKPGGNNIVGYTALFNAPRDGYTLILGQSPNYNINVLFQNATYKIEDLAFVNMFQMDRMIFYVNKDAPWKTLADLIADAKRRPGQIKMGAAGTLTMDPVYVKEFEDKAGVKFGEIIPMGGGATLRREVLGGHIMLAVHGAWVARAAKPMARGLGIRALERSPIWPEAGSFNIVIPPDKKYTEEDINLLPTFIKGFAVSVDVKKNYSERFNKLVKTFERTVDRPEFAAMIKKLQMETAFRYYPPDETEKVVDAFTNLLNQNRPFFEKKRK